MPKASQAPPHRGQCSPTMYMATRVSVLQKSCSRDYADAGKGDTIFEIFVSLSCRPAAGPKSDPPATEIWPPGDRNLGHFSVDFLSQRRFPGPDRGRSGGPEYFIWLQMDPKVDPFGRFASGHSPVRPPVHSVWRRYPFSRNGAGDRPVPGNFPGTGQESVPGSSRIAGRLVTVEASSRK